MVRSDDGPAHSARMRGVSELREKFLDSLDGDVVPIALLDTLITESGLAPAAVDRHRLALELVATLLHEDLILVGGVVGGDPAYIQRWTGSRDEILDRIRHLYVDNFGNTHGWDLVIWLSSNDPRRVWGDGKPAL